MAIMSSTTQTVSGPPARIDKPTFLGILWGGVVLTTLFYTFRIIIRIKSFRRLYLDDFFVLLAWILLFANTLIWQIEVDSLYENIAVANGNLWPIPADFEHNLTTYLRSTIAVIIFFYSSLWSVKISFLLFFRRLGQKVRRQKLLWWTVFIIVVASYFALLGTIQYQCLDNSFWYIVENCTSDRAIRFEKLTLRANLAIDVITDALIILVPINMLWKVQIDMRCKLALAGIFSITVFIMIFAIVRLQVVSQWSAEPDQTWLYMWSSVEQTVAITVACLASFRALFTNSDRPTRLCDNERNAESDSSRRILRDLSMRTITPSKSGKTETTIVPNSSVSLFVTRKSLDFMDPTTNLHGNPNIAPPSRNAHAVGGIQYMVIPKVAPAAIRK